MHAPTHRLLPELVFKWAIGLALFEQLQFNCSMVSLPIRIISYTGWISLHLREHLLDHASCSGLSWSLPHEERISRSPVGVTKSPGTKKKNTLNLSLNSSKTMFHCVGPPDWKHFSFSNSFLNAFIHLGFPKRMRVGAFLGGRRGWEG